VILRWLSRLRGCRHDYQHIYVEGNPVWYTDPVHGFTVALLVCKRCDTPIIIER
jgi:hypothetical protein